jgi:hypothetical protein
MLVGAALVAAVFGSPATAGQVLAKDGRFEADVSARQMSRISIIGERIASVRKLDEPGGPQVLVETDDRNGDAFVAFDGDVAGRAFNLFLTTDTGKVVQAVLHPAPGEGQTILVRLEGGATAAAGPQSGSRNPDPSPAVAGPRPDSRSAYAESLVQFVRVMFNDQEVEGITRQVANAPSVRAGPFIVREVTTWDSSRLRGRVLYITNLGKADEPIRLEAFLVERVYAVGSSHERLHPGEQGRVFIVEEGR